MGRIVVFLAFLAVVLVVSDAQLTFSTGWGQGKRSGPGSVEPEPCSPEEGLYMLYKLIQAEAEKIVACRDDGKS